MKRALLVMGQGSRSPDAAPEMLRVVNAVRNRIDYDVVMGVFLESCPPSLSDGIASAVAAGAAQVVVAPYLLSLDVQVKKDLLQRVEEARRRHPGVEIVTAEHIGMDDRMADVICDRARAAEMRMTSAGGRPVLTVDGLVRHPLSLTYADLLAAPEQVEDVSLLAPDRQGSGLRVRAVLRKADPKPSATRITFHSADGGFKASVSLEEALERGILIYRLHDGPLSERMGGPVRLIIPGAEDACNNVKRVVRMEIRP